MEKEIRERLISIKKEIDKTLAFYDKFDKEVSIYTNLLHAQIYSSFGDDYKREMLGETIENPKYYSACFNFTDSAKNDKVSSEDYINRARRLNNIDWENTPYLFWYNHDELKYRIINWVSLTQMLKNDEEQYSIQIKYTRDEINNSGTYRFNLFINKEDYKKLVEEAVKESKKR